MKDILFKLRMRTVVQLFILYFTSCLFSMDKPQGEVWMGGLWTPLFKRMFFFTYSFKENIRNLKYHAKGQGELWQVVRGRWFVGFLVEQGMTGWYVDGWFVDNSHKLREPKKQPRKQNSEFNIPSPQTAN